VEENLIFAGLGGLEDPPRPEVPEALRKCREAGITVIMVTGDHPFIAKAIGREIGLTRSDSPLIITGDELRALTDTQLRLALDTPEIIFARVGADQKRWIVEALKRKGHVVAATGDGVNDAPALKSAHIGIAMGISGTDVAKEAADMVLLDDNFASIVNAVEEGRAVFSNIRKFLTYILAHNVPELIPYLVFSLFSVPLALTPIQILSIDMGTDSLTALGLGVEKPDPRIMQRPPRLAASAALRLAVGGARLIVPGRDRSGDCDGGVLLRAARRRMALRRGPRDARSAVPAGDHRLPERDRGAANRERVSVS
jgi:sodium/potassium-transporting ATPase subunit alpha